MNFAREGTTAERGIPREIPVVTAYVIRHGETTENKLDPNRGLTKRGEVQINEVAEKLIRELNPQRDVIQILDSGNYRANVTVMHIATKLKSAGFSFFEPEKLDALNMMKPKDAGVQTVAEPKSKKYRRIDAANIPDEFKKQLSDPALHERLGIPDGIADKRMAAWYLGDWPDEVEKPEEVAARVQKGTESTQKLLPMLAGQLGLEKRIVVISAANASAIDATITTRTGSSVIDRMGEVENGEGFKINFDLDTEPLFEAWGEKIETQISKH